ncbi:MAG: methyltransferase domain-containing protein [Sulfuricurvum sp.]|nr:methyltransferase domain-containing protein [Sulfuricurvum sp.]
MSATSCETQQIITLYSDLALNPHKDFGWDKGIENARNQGYKEEWIEQLPVGLWDYCAAVGNPFLLGEFPIGSTVLDLGCGAGVDVCVAAMLVGESAKVIGVDITPLMVETARRHAQEAKLYNIQILEATLESLPLEDNSIDIIISNGAITLTSSKEKVFAEAFRVLRGGGKLYFVDMIKRSDIEVSACCAQDSWADCVAGTLEEGCLLAQITGAGFSDAQCMGHTGYTTSASTIGATFRAVKKG